MKPEVSAKDEGRFSHVSRTRPRSSNAKKANGQQLKSKSVEAPWPTTTTTGAATGTFTMPQQRNVLPDCVFCLDAPTDPCTTVCGHIFCRTQVHQFPGSGEG